MGKRGVGIVPVVVVAIGITYPFVAAFWRWPLSTSPQTLDRPTQALAALRDFPCRGNVFNDYTYGGLMIMSLPGVPVYIDGRMPSWHGLEGSYLDRYVQVLKGEEIMQTEFARYDVQCVLLSDFDTKLSDALANDPQWRRTIKAQNAELWRRDSVGDRVPDLANNLGVNGTRRKLTAVNAAQNIMMCDCRWVMIDDASKTSAEPPITKCGAKS
ncbi:hypothetical protein IPG36_02035 [bacterium]|nr:MAG: hypothetical protein IPG36_02035 [bacterium]